MLGIGTDILAMERFRNILRTGGAAFIEQVYSEAEQEAAKSSDDRESYLAVRFAGKEAVFKCLDTNWEKIPTLRDIEILAAPSGAPRVFLHGAAGKEAERKGVGSVLISLSFEREYAVAMAVALPRQENC